MRWLVEVTSLGKAERDALHVEAESWQKALQSARAQRGEAAPMSGFSIELLDEGCRAVDPMSRLRYEVRKARDDGTPAARSVAPRPLSSIPPRPAAGTPAAANAPSVPAAANVPSVPAAANAPSVPAASTPAPAKKSVPVGSQTVLLGSAGPTAVEAPHTSVPVAPPAPSAFAPPAPPTSARTDVASNVPSQVIFKREQDATEALPLTYREYVYLVPPGTSEAAAEILLRTQLELVTTSLERVPPGKLVNLGVFDISFQGKPPVPPLATLSWKDWRGAPVVVFPRRAAPPPHSAPVSALHPSPVSAPHPAPAHPPQPVPVSASRHAPVSVQQPAPVSAPQPAPALAPAPSAPLSLASTVVIAPAPAAVPASVHTVPTVPVAFSPPAPSFNLAPPGGFPVLEVPAPAPPVVHAPVAATMPQARHAAPAQPVQPRQRLRSEDLIADLFESMHNLHFVRDALEGGEFCLTLALEKIPSEFGIVHLYDIDRREFLVTTTRGLGTSKLLLRRHAENDALLASAMRKRRALVVDDAAQSDATGIDRYVALGGVRSVIVAPVMQSGRFLGAIELMNPLDGKPFSESDGNALSYIAEQFAEFVATRGVVTDPERISGRSLHDG